MFQNVSIGLLFSYSVHISIFEDVLEVCRHAPELLHVVGVVHGPHGPGAAQVAGEDVSAEVVAEGGEVAGVEHHVVGNIVTDEGSHHGHQHCEQSEINKIPI